MCEVFTKLCNHPYGGNRWNFQDIYNLGSATFSSQVHLLYKPLVDFSYAIEYRKETEIEMETTSLSSLFCYRKV